MKRLNIRYNGQGYTLADTDLDDLKSRISGVMAGADSFWLRVNEGEGSYRATDILINAHSQISVSGIDSE